MGLRGWSERGQHGGDVQGSRKRAGGREAAWAGCGGAPPTCPVAPTLKMRNKGQPQGPYSCRSLSSARSAVPQGAGGLSGP